MVGRNKEDGKEGLAYGQHCLGYEKSKEEEERY